MRKTCLFIFLLSLTVLWIAACGGSGGGISGTPDQPSIGISPMNPNVLVGQTMQFTANIQNLSDTRVAWSVREVNGGTIASTDAGGIYTAPWPVGIYHVVATSVADSTLTTNTMVSVTAKFAFLEEYPSGDASPFSMTPMIATVGTDGNIGISGVTDQGTGNPVSVAMEAVTLSSDGTNAAFDVETPDYTYDVFTANADGTGSPTQLTFDGESWYPEFSADGLQILYMRGSDIWSMNVDGSNQHVIFPATASSATGYSATLSPDGSMIAAELEWNPGGTYHDGIAIMNADGTNAVPLTGGSDFPCAVGWDEMPAFTHDGTQIMFSRYCDDNFTSTLYTMNTDGTGLTLLYAATPGVLHYNPIPVSDKIVFQTNQDIPYTIGFEIYRINTDGSGITRLTSNTLFDGFDTNWWNSGASLATSQPVVRTFSNRSPAHGAARRAERIKNQQQRYRR